MNLEDLHKVWEIKTLKKPGEEEAHNILNRISKQVQPIMRRRRWRVKVLSEFCPTNPSLLGLNVGAGSEVKLRLRRPNRDWDFFPFEQVLDTMLHELCHIEHGPHNAQFYKLWDELRKECDDLVAKGIAGTGEGFDGPGRRLGGFTRQPPASSLRQTALAAAQKRARVGPLLPSGPRRLGGDDVIMSSLSPIQAAAMAAERRMLDDLWCGSVSPEIERINGLEALGESPSNSSSHRSTPPSVSTSSLSAVDNIDDKLAWECNVCTLLNQPLAPICEACGTQMPKPLQSNYKIWSCKFCTLENSIKLDKCSACEQWRYSYGPPVSTRSPNYGT
ncbi:DNA-dependent metalloprotease WSS1 isoform X1 [Dendrobium catenatum]|uniref:DNA-dependent metalloprotease WSS1 isoform X1 n=1 Tax=Dendrobium catenatum TaxID=906689 RepID=UPI0009F36DFD|nr:DNA-dependent metalloprotease WSS1 isoform X1 [Dendrobium catenatum]XP_028552360.1 DNA-dependent metalloprotease WSS1 isoform X1 [Dendrobium catenatum]XP_028552363.1 DNA-dependent metalloprotease WSS1 isoform X1 [Dendrobium catenatum]